MAKRLQDGTGEERAISKSKPTKNSVSQAFARPSMAQRTDASNRPGVLNASSADLGLLASTGILVAGNSSPNEEASTSQVWQTNAETISAGRNAAW